MRKLLLGLVASLPLAAAAQEAAPQLEQDPRAARIREVERGLFVGFEVGWVNLGRTPASGDTLHFPFAFQDGGAASGFAAGLNVGYDITSRLALSAFFLSHNVQANLSYGAFDVLAWGGDVRFAFLGLSDANGVERFYLYAHGRVGYVRSYPDGLFASSDVLLGAGLGIEYFTRLRHFSVGLAVDGLYLKDVHVAGLSVAPTLRYTF